VKHEMEHHGHPTRTYAIVPVKETSKAKGRLAQALTARDRRNLATAMLSDVLDALRRTRAIQRILIITRDINAARLGTQNGAFVIPEGRAKGLNYAIMKGLRFAESQCADQVLVIPADVPLAKSSDFRAILRTAQENDVVIVPSHDLRGTNALVLHLPRTMPVSYGIDSFRRHRRLAREKNLRIQVLKLPSLGLDADTPLDLIRIRSAPGNTLSQRFLRKALCTEP
jgi:2-phospho-L-lactate guanylyltransferase